jgi:hypothetical protein
MYRIAYGLAIAALLAAGGAAQASDPIGGYLIVDRVVLEPANAPTTIQIWGSFVLAAEFGGRAWSAPERGYLSYKTVPGKEAVCRKEWNDMKNAAGTSQVIGFGSSYELKNLGAVRKATEKPQAPLPYPLGVGLVKVERESGHVPIRTLRGLPIPQSPADGSLVSAGEITLVVRNIADQSHARAKYVFTLEGEGGSKEEATVAAGEKETRWTPKRKLTPGGRYTWRVRAVDGEWRGPEAVSSFVVKEEP